MKRKLMYTVFIFGLIALYFFRVYNLEQDLPPWGIGYYQPVDEGAYSLMALNYMHYGSINPLYDAAGHSMCTPLQCRTNIFGNVISILSLSIFGNNYYGFRIGYVFLGFAILLIYILCVRFQFQNLGNTYNENTKIMILAIAWLLFDFMFYMGSRTVENSIVRLFFNLLIVYICIRLKESYRLRFFCISLLSVMSVFLVYVTNIFILLSLFLFVLSILLLQKNKKNGMRAVMYTFLGALCAFIISEMYYRIAWNSNVVASTIDIVKSFSDSNGYKITGLTNSGILKSLLYNFLSFWGSNSLLYNLPVVFLFIALLPFMAKKYILQSEEGITYMLLCIVAFMMQTLFVEDCIGRKIIVVYPMFLIIILRIITDRKYLWEYYDKMSIWRRMLYSYYLLFDLFICALIVYYRFRRAQDNTYLDFDRTTKISIVVLGFGVVCLCYIFFMVKLCKISLIKKVPTLAIFSIVIIMSIVLNISLIYRFSFKNPTFYDRESMKALNDYVGLPEVYVTGGGFQLGFILYNDMKYIMGDSTDNIKQIMESEDNIYIIDYEQLGDDVNEHFNNYYFKGGKYTLEPIYVIKRNFQAYGLKRNFCLYRKVEYER